MYLDKKFECVRHYQKLVETLLWNLKKKENGLDQRWEGLSYRYHNWSAAKLCRCSCIHKTVVDLKNIKSSFLASLFHVSSCKENMYHHRHSPAESGSWCKYNADSANNTQTKPGPCLIQNTLFIEIRPKFGIKERHWIWKVAAL